MTESTPDNGGQWEAIKLFDMREGFSPVKNVVGVGDPDVHKIGDRWTMFLGGFTNRFKVNLFAATLPPGSPLSSTEWSLATSDADPTVALPLVGQPPRGSWDHHGLHTPSYVRGVDPKQGPRERIYYSGRSSRQSTGPKSRYAIGCVERTPAGWARHDAPVLTGTPERPSVFEPLVRYYDQKWRMWYVSAVHEVGRGELPNYQFEYVESVDGLTGWSTPKVLFSVEEGIFDNAVTQVDSGYEMVVARGHDLYDTPGFPAQGMWWLAAERPSGDRRDWTREPARILDASNAPLPWYANGAFGPSVNYGDTEADRDVMYVFFTGVHAKASWARLAAGRLLTLRKPPVPAPFYFAVGRMECRRG